MAHTPDLTVDADATHDHDGHDDGHPTPTQYVQIAVVLAILTIMEIATAVVELGGLFLPTLLFLMVVKFGLVTSWFMHLRFDSRVFRRMLVLGLVLAVAVFSIVLIIFNAGKGGSLSASSLLG